MQSDSGPRLTLGEVAVIEMGQSPSSRYVYEEERGVPFLQGNAEFGSFHPEHRLYCLLPTKMCHTGDVLISVRAPVGALNKADREYCIGRGLAAVRFIGLPSDFGWHLLNHWAPSLHRVAQGTTFQAVSKTDLEGLSIGPPFTPGEQHRITVILDTVDEAISRTEQVIAKLRQVKAGLLQDLLTCGLDEQGQLRDPVAQPEQFRDSPLGKIAKQWELTTLGEVVNRAGGFIQTGPFGSQLHAHEYTEEGVPVIMPQDIRDGTVSVTQIARVPLEKALTLARHRVEINDVVFARRGDLGRCAPIGRREVGWLCGTGCLLLRAPEGELVSRWLAAAYQHDRSQRQISARAVGSTMVNLNTSLLQGLAIARPMYDEQSAIAEALDFHDDRISAEEAYRDKLDLVKAGLMDDLLTGKVRVLV